MKRFYNAIFRVVEFVTMSELSDQGKKLILNYIEEAAHRKFSFQARYVIKRYSGKDIPTLDEIRRRHKTEGLSDLDDAVLRMEYEAEQLEKAKPL